MRMESRNRAKKTVSQDQRLGRHSPSWISERRRVAEAEGRSGEEARAEADLLPGLPP